MCGFRPGVGKPIFDIIAWRGKGADMDWASGDIVSVIYYLLPGFVAAWVFYGLTAHPKASPFERVVQALIFTVVV